MPRPKGSKNKKTIVKASNALTFESSIEELIAKKEVVLTEILSLDNQMEALKEEIKGKKALVKSIEKEIVSLTEKKEAEEKAKAEEKRKAELTTIIDELLSSGLSTSEIISKIKG